MRLIFVGLAIVLAGCQTYQTQPLRPQQVMHDVITDRNSHIEEKRVTFQQAMAWMSAYNADLQALKLAYAALDESSKIATPLPNPSVEAGLLHGTRLDALEASRTQPFVGLGFAVPLGRRLSAEDDLRSAQAEAARVELIATHRKLYLQLRGTFLQLAMMEERLRLHAGLIEDTRAMRTVTAEAVDQGYGTALDVGVMDLELGQLELAHRELRWEADSLRHELAQLIGVKVTWLAALEPMQTGEIVVPTEEEIPEILLYHQSRLAQLRADYEVSERSLRLEIARQYPDLEIGFGGEQEAGERARIFELGIGIEIPLFDRNERGILEARQERLRIQKAYEAACRQILAEIDSLRSRRHHAAENQKTIETRLLPVVEQSLASARQLLEAGRMDAANFLLIQRQQRDLELQRWDARYARLEAELELEAVLGCVLGMPLTEEGSTPIPKWNEHVDDKEQP